MKPKTRFEVFKRDNFTCRYCGKKSPEAILEIDHALPLSAGGTDDLDNLITACYECNRGKAANLLTKIPQELDFHEKAILLEEQELQIAEYKFWRAQQHAREDKELLNLERKWVMFWSEHWFRRTDVRKFLRKLNYHDLIEIIEEVDEKLIPQEGLSRGEAAWRFFCWLCHRRIKGD